MPTSYWPIGYFGPYTTTAPSGGSGGGVGPYAHTTFLAAKTQLLNRLGNNTFWTDAEVGLYIIEALRVWNAAAMFHRDRGLFYTVNGTTFYDISTVLDNNGTKLLERIITDRDLIKEIKYHLMENVPADLATFSEQFTLDDITRAIERRTNQFLLETGCTITHSTLALGSPPVSQLQISDSIIDIRRVALIDSFGNYRTLWRNNETQLWNYNQSLGTSGDAQSYSVALTPINSIRLYPPQTSSGTLELLTLNVVGTLVPQSTATILPVPTDLAWVIKYGAMADLLGKDGPPNAVSSSVYCESRYQQGVALAQVAFSTMLQAEITGVRTQIDSVAGSDAFSPSWQTTGSPTSALSAGFHLVGLSPRPDGVYSITMDVIKNAPVPVDDDDYIQIGREQLDAILDYAQHIAQFKQGAAEIEMTKPHMDRFIALASQHNDRLAALNQNLPDYQALSRIEESARPRMVQP